MSLRLSQGRHLSIGLTQSVSILLGAMSPDVWCPRAKVLTARLHMLSLAFQDRHYLFLQAHKDGRLESLGLGCIRRKDTTGSCQDVLIHGNCTAGIMLCSPTPRILPIGFFWSLKTVSLSSVAQAGLKGHGNSHDLAFQALG